MLLKDLITELETISTDNLDAIEVWLKDFNTAALSNETISLEEFYSVYHKVKNLLGFIDQETTSPLCWSPASSTTTNFSSPGVIDYHEELGKAVVNTLSSFSLSVTKSDKEMQLLIGFLNAEYAYLSTYFPVDISVCGANEIKWINELSEEPYLQNCLKWFLFSQTFANSDDATRALFLTLNQLTRAYFSEPAHLLLDLLIKKLRDTKDKQKQFYFNAILICLLSGETPYPELNAISLAVLDFNLLAQTNYEQILVRYINRFNQAKTASSAQEKLTLPIGICNQLALYELIKFRRWLWREDVLLRLSVGKLQDRPFTDSASVILNRNEVLVTCEMRDILKILSELERTPNTMPLLIACKSIASQPLTNGSLKTQYLLNQKKLLKKIYAFFADNSKIDFEDNLAPPLNTALWEPITFCVKEISSRLNSPEAKPLTLASLKENVASFFHTSALQRSISAASKAIVDKRITPLRLSLFNTPKKEAEHLCPASINAIDI